MKTWFGEFESAVEEQWHLTLVMHPEVIGRGYRMLALRELLNRYAERATTSPTASSPTPWLLPLPRRPDRAVVRDDVVQARNGRARASRARGEPLTASDQEQRVCDHIAARENELVDLLQRLVGYDTAAREPDRSGGDIEGIQRFLAARLQASGAAAELEEPPASLVAGHAYVPHGFDFAGRPQLVARFAGADGGPSLLRKRAHRCRHD
ncbi:MAG: hypothetical protein H0W08_04110 [Acidobacteria bacterium]|nr:hypothetical protein [Acidobacteriota bacterium]